MGLGNSQKIFPQILVVSLSIRDEHPDFAYDQTQDDYVTIDLHMSFQHQIKFSSFDIEKYKKFIRLGFHDR